MSITPVSVSPRLARVPSAIAALSPVPNTATDENPLVVHIADQIRAALDAIGHKPERMRAFHKQREKEAAERAKQVLSFSDRRTRESALDVRERLIQVAAISVASRYGSPKAYVSPNTNFLKKERQNIETLGPYGITGQLWGDAILSEPRLLELTTSKIRDNLECNLVWLPIYGVEDRFWVKNVCMGQLPLLYRDPAVLKQHFELMLVIQEGLAARLAQTIKSEDFKRDSVKTILTRGRALTNSTTNFLLRLAAAELFEHGTSSDIGISAPRPKIESIVIGELGHNPQEKVIPRVHTMPENDAATKVRLDQEIGDYVKQICGDLRERWPASKLPQPPTLPISSVFLPDSPSRPPREAKRKMLELMVIAGTFENRYTLTDGPH